MLENNYIFDRSYADRLKLREILKKENNREATRSKLLQNSNFDKSRFDKAMDTELESGYIALEKKDTGGSRSLRIYKLIKED